MLHSPLILFVDGNPDDLERYRRHLALSSANFNVVQAATGKSGLAFCERHAVDCVVLEIELPDVSGFEVLLKLVPHFREPKVAVIMLTRLSNAYLLDAAMRNGAQAAFSKLVTSPDTLERAILKAVSTMSADLTTSATSGQHLDKSVRLS
ncbi:MAG TPA: response regulator [Nitrospira sp.]|nr:response regulator [Nitrospira sp.]